MKKRSVTRVHLICSPRQELPSRLPPVIQVLSGSLTIAALATLLRPVYSLHLALSFAALSIVGVWTMMLYGTPSKLVDVSPSCSLDWGRRVSYSTPG